MPPSFGTSGLRGLVVELTPDLVADHVRAFLAACEVRGRVHLGWDLRPSSPAIAAVVEETLCSAGRDVVRAGAVPTPALALAALAAGEAAVMVTGSHIPADRNGLKFYRAGGEITKADEAGILAALGRPAPGGPRGRVVEDPGCGPRWAARMATAFGPDALAGLRLGIYQHSSVARNLLGAALSALGAEVVPLARSETFVPVDTEAVDPETRAELAAWCAEHRLDAMVSTDGDADRPMVTDAGGALVPGDVLGPLTARMLGAEVVITPVSSNSLVEEMDLFRVIRTRIGSPYVIAGMAAEAGRRAFGYEANGGALLGFEARGPAGPLPALMTRDCLLPIVAPLAAARAAGQSLAETVAALPRRFTAADRLQGVAPERARAFLDRLLADAGARAAFFGRRETSQDLTDGLRLGFEGGEVVHLRPSGNAPEFRVYAEASDPDRARELLADHLSRLAAEMGI